VFSNQVFKSVLRRALLEEGQEIGVFDPMGSGSITFDITEIYPKSPADFVDHRCRLCLDGAVSAIPHRQSNFIAVTNQITAWSSESVYAAFLGEFVFNTLNLWNRGIANPDRLPIFAMPGQTMQSLTVDYPVGPKRHSTDCYFSMLQITAHFSYRVP
jgi:hypothetical protein